MNMIDSLLISDLRASSSNKRYIYSSNREMMFGKISPFENPMQILSTIGKDIFFDKKINEDLSIQDFFMKFCPPRVYKPNNYKKMIDYIINPLFLSAISSVSQRVLYNEIMQPTYSASKDSKFWGMISTTTGLSGLIGILENQLSSKPELKIDLKHNSKIEKISFRKNVTKVVLNISKSLHEFDHVISTVAAPQLYQVLPNRLIELKNSLGSIKYSSVASVILEYSTNDIGNFNLSGFGFLVPATEISIAPIIGVIFDSNLFPQIPRQNYIFTV
ncbi:hypothetical protein MXB_3609 [Myxobolus squamalis]|nr:hypothetical protein MXB_3609 [Myxobolus squamalis]